jgi:endonuclease/exonuclease/phosphatase family metal-dependent hydrolase
MEVTVMSFNIRYDTEYDGSNAWCKRNFLVRDVIEKYNCDFVCIQESLVHQAHFLEKNLSEYKSVFRSREFNSDEGESVPIFYQYKKWEVVEYETFWLSETPYAAGSVNWGNSLPRIVTWIKFRNLSTQQLYFVYNTHLDHESKNSRHKSVEMIVNHISSKVQNTPFVLTGDFNEENGMAIKYLINSKLNPIDTFSILPESEREGTFHLWNGKSFDRYDFIFVSPDTQILETTIIKDNDKRRYPSDHFPIMSRLII